MDVDKETVLEYAVLGTVSIAIPSLYWYVTGHPEPAMAGYLLALLFSESTRFLAAMACAVIIGYTVYFFWTELFFNLPGSVGEAVMTFVYMLYAFIRGYMTVN